MKIGFDTHNPELFTIISNKIRHLGHTVIYCTPQGINNLGESIYKRVLMANHSKVDMFISINIESGVENSVLVYSKLNESLDFINSILSGFQKEGFDNKGIKDGGKYYIIKNVLTKSYIINITLFDEEDKFYNMISELILKALELYGIN
ncbi:N-acetylmuramoyl-L-alanine amidase [Clostridium amylolyticum]|uniref:N-acetylmuramoyl-L-alanine amidase n=1 Tax=Clostridium amylolyticum TaxID=1121298 RepID=UPI000933EABE|nr:N-acetylmuramoyl-L-alanine amidase [Clostridium amylolyticum]